jgi:hypothetical protein
MDSEVLKILSLEAIWNFSNCYQIMEHKWPVFKALGLSGP